MAEPTPASEPNRWTLLRAEFSVAKGHKAWAWTFDAGAAVLAVSASFSPWPRAGLIASLGAVAAKLLAKNYQSKSRSSFRLAETGRRHHFQERTLGWRPPPNEIADLNLKLSPEGRTLAAKHEAKLAANYYASEGPPSAELFVSNLHESMFSTEKLAGVMAGRRSRQLMMSIGAVILVLIGTLLTPWAAIAGPVLKTLSVGTTLLVSLDLFGEMRAFSRSERAIRDLAAELLALAGPPVRDEKTALRVMEDYNCLLVELPLIPDAVRDAHQPAIDRAWLEVASRAGLQTGRTG